jgi:hypothetical protein
LIKLLWADGFQVSGIFLMPLVPLGKNLGAAIGMRLYLRIRMNLKQGKASGVLLS